MLIKVLGIIDVLLGVFLIFLGQLNFPAKVLLVFAIILLVKASLGLFQDFASWVDGVAGLFYILSTIIHIPAIIGIILGLLLIQKGVFSFL